MANMTNWDIAQKLLPFTFSDEKGTHFSLFALNLGDWIITFFILVLVGVFAHNIWKLSKSKATDEKMVVRLYEALEKYKDKMQSQYNEFVAELDVPAQSTNELATLWQEFDESLIKSTNPHTGQVEIRNSIDAEYFFNKHSLLTHLGTKFYASIPSLLLGIGLIGTFVGLFYGLVQLNMDDADTLKESMRTLIHAAGVKFASSIWGLGLSLLFTFYEKRAEGKLEKQIDDIQWLVNIAFTRKTAEQSLAVMEAQSIAQTEQLQSLSISLTEDSVNKLSDALGQKIKETLEESIGKPIQTLTANMGGSAEQTLYQRLDALAGGMSDGFSEAMRNLMTQMVDEIRGVAGADAQQLQDTLQGLATTLAGLQTSLINSANQTQQATDTTLTALNTALESIEQTMSRQTQSMDESMLKLLSVIDAQSLATQGSTAQLKEGAVEATGQISTEVRRALADIQDTFSGIKSTIEQSQQHLAPVPHYLQQFAEGTKNLNESATSANNATSILGGSVTKLSGFETALSQSLVDVRKTLELQQSQLQGISAQLTNTTTQAQEISQHSKETYEQLANAYQDLLTKNKESVAQFTQNVQAYQEQANQNIAHTLAAFDGQLKDFASSLSGAIGELNEAVSDLADTVPRR